MFHLMLTLLWSVANSLAINSPGHQLPFHAKATKEDAVCLARSS